jgi:hypothetical protein
MEISEWVRLGYEVGMLVAVCYLWRRRPVFPIDEARDIVREALQKEGYHPSQVDWQRQRLDMHRDRIAELKQGLDKLEHFFVGVRAKLKDR